MKRILAAALIVVLALSLTACGCKHERWLDATCTSPAICANCGKTQGQPTAHQWVDATCVRPKHCAVCNLTEGDLGDHIWKETFLSLNICTECGMIEGDAVAFPLTDGQRVSIDGHSTFAINGWGYSEELLDGDTVIASADKGSYVLWISFDYTNLSDESIELFRVFTAPVLLVDETSTRGQFAMNGRYELPAHEKRTFYICYTIPEWYISSGKIMDAYFFDSGLTYTYTIDLILEEVRAAEAAE